MNFLATFNNDENFSSNDDNEEEGGDVDIDSEWQFIYATLFNFICLTFRLLSLLTSSESFIDWMLESNKYKILIIWNVQKLKNNLVNKITLTVRYRQPIVYDVLSLERQYIPVAFEIIF